MLGLSCNVGKACKAVEEIIASQLETRCRAALAGGWRRQRCGATQGAHKWQGIAGQQGVQGHHSTRKGQGRARLGVRSALLHRHAEECAGGGAQRGFP